MAKYIDKSALVAEIERRISVLKANESVISMLAGGMFINEFKDLLSFIDTLDVKEVDEEYNGKAMLHVLTKGVEQGKREILDKACKWLSKHFYDKDYEIRDDEGCWIDADLMITDFRKAMEE